MLAEFSYETSNFINVKSIFHHIYYITSFKDNRDLCVYADRTIRHNGLVFQIKNIYTFGFAAPLSVCYINVHKVSMPFFAYFSVVKG